MAALVALGVDPGFRNLGAGIVRFEALSTRVIHSETARTDTSKSHDERIDFFVDRLCELIETHEPRVLGYENQAGVEVAMQREGEGTNFSSRKVHEVTGAIRAVARFYALPCYCIAVSTVKVALLGKGGGGASKEQMRLGVKRFFGIEGSEHAADAIACAVAAARRYRIEQSSLRRAAALIR